MTIAIRDARPGDAATIAGMVRALADYEHLAHEVETDEARLAETLFAPQPRAFCLIAEEDGEAAGMALWFYTYSTFRGRHGIWLEDLFVLPQRRGRGAGRGLVEALARRCASEDLARLEWSVLKWNEPSIGFYDALGAVSLSDWAIMRLAGAPLARLAEEAEVA